MYLPRFVNRADKRNCNCQLTFCTIHSGVSSNPGPNKPISSAAIAGGAAGGAVLLIIAAVLVFLFFKRQEHRKNRTTGNLDFFDDPQPIHHGQPTNAETQPLFQVTPFTHTPSIEQQYQPYQPSNAPSTSYLERSPVTSGEFFFLFILDNPSFMLQPTSCRRNHPKAGEGWDELSLAR